MAIKLNTFIELIEPVITKDAASFATTRDQVVACARAYKEVRHASSAWVNRAVYSKATVLFRLRTIPGTVVSAAMVITDGEGRYEIDSIEVIRGRYLEVLAHETTPEGTQREGGRDGSL